MKGWLRLQINGFRFLVMKSSYTTKVVKKNAVFIILYVLLCGT